MYNNKETPNKHVTLCIERYNKRFRRKSHACGTLITRTETLILIECLFIAYVICHKTNMFLLCNVYMYPNGCIFFISELQNRVFCTSNIVV